MFTYTFFFPYIAYIVETHVKKKKKKQWSEGGKKLHVGEQERSVWERLRNVFQYSFRVDEEMK